MTPAYKHVDPIVSDPEVYKNYFAKNYGCKYNKKCDKKISFKYKSHAVAYDIDIRTTTKFYFMIIEENQYTIVTKRIIHGVLFKNWYHKEVRTDAINNQDDVSSFLFRQYS